MKRLLTTLLPCIVILGSLSACNHAFSDSIRGSGRMVTRQMAAIPFEALHTSRSVEVILVANSDSICIEADDNLIDYVTIEQLDGTLSISMAPDILFRHATVRVSVPTDGRIHTLHASSSSEISCQVPLTAEELHIYASSSAEIIAAATVTRCQIAASSSSEIEAGIHADQCSITGSSSADITLALITRTCDVECSSSADITIKGEADQCTATCTSSADYSADQFITRYCDVNASSSADAMVHCTQTLIAKASSAGSILYMGTCTVDAHTSSAGSISRK